MIRIFTDHFISFMPNYEFMLILMLRIRIILLISYFMSSAVLSGQKAELMLVKHVPELALEVNVTDEGLNILYDESMTPLSDTVFLHLDYSKRFFLRLDNYNYQGGNEPLISVYLNNTPIIIIHANIEPGDYSWPFSSGIEKPVLRIVGGTTVAIRDYPWQVFIRSGDFLCGGTIIADKWILTAAHCLFDDNDKRIPDDDITFTVGVNRPYSGTSEGRDYNVKFSVIHENYDGLEFESDLALLRTTDVIEDENARPINLITEEEVNSGATDPGINAIITGWGLIDVDPVEFPIGLQKLEIPIVEKSVAEVVWGPLPDNMIMAGFLNNAGDACSGDSGGPMIVKVNDEYKLAGIISWGSSGCNSIGGYTRISSFLEWIRKNSGVHQDQYKTIRPYGKDFRCQGSISDPFAKYYFSDTLADAIEYEWKIEPEEAGSLAIANDTIADVSWSSAFAGEAYISARALTPEGYTNWAGQRVQTGEITRILSQPKDTSVCQYTDFRLRIEAVGSDLKYSWFKEGTLIRRGEDPFYDLNNLKLSNEGMYNVEIRGNCGIALSTPLDLEVLPETEITEITYEPEVSAGSILELEAIAEGDNLNYLWLKENQVINSTKINKLEIENINANATGLYSLSVEGTCGTDSAGPLYIYVDPEINEFPAGINIWPTLTRDFINIAVQGDEIFDIFIYDSMGKYMGRKIKCKYKTILDLSNFSPDLYILQIRFDQSTKTYRVAKVNN